MSDLKEDPVAFIRRVYPDLRMDSWQARLLKEIAAKPNTRFIVKFGRRSGVNLFSNIMRRYQEENP